MRTLRYAALATLTLVFIQGVSLKNAAAQDRRGGFVTANPQSAEALADFSATVMAELLAKERADEPALRARAGKLRATEKKLPGDRGLAQIEGNPPSSVLPKPSISDQAAKSSHGGVAASGDAPCVTFKDPSSCEDTAPKSFVKPIN